jgi:putative restriction endonuclease
MPEVEVERQRRQKLWQSLPSEKDSLDPQLLRSLGIYGGAQGIWVDKAQTANAEIGPDGATVSILHTGRHYADDLSDHGLIYHYPKTLRPPSRDAAEVQATKNAMAAKLPIFVILPGVSSSSKRSIKLGWVSDFDDANRQFLVLFSEQLPSYSFAPAANADFALTTDSVRGKATIKTRPGQQRFRFQVLSQYGLKCAVCHITHPLLLTAAHICGKSQNGSDDWRNGLPLCPTHHQAFDSHLFAIEPDTYTIRCAPNLKPEQLGLAEETLRPTKQHPHSIALNWRWTEVQKRWGLTASSERDAGPPPSAGQPTSALRGEADL